MEVLAEPVRLVNFKYKHDVSHCVGLYARIRTPTLFLVCSYLVFFDMGVKPESGFIPPMNRRFRYLYGWGFKD